MEQNELFFFYYYYSGVYNQRMTAGLTRRGELRQPHPFLVVVGPVKQVVRPSAGAIHLTWTLKHFEHPLQLPKVLIDLFTVEKGSERRGRLRVASTRLLQKDN